MAMATGEDFRISQGKIDRAKYNMSSVENLYEYDKIWGKERRFNYLIDDNSYRFHKVNINKIKKLEETLKKYTKPVRILRRSSDMLRDDRTCNEVMKATGISLDLWMEIFTTKVIGRTSTRMYKKILRLRGLKS